MGNYILVCQLKTDGKLEVYTDITTIDIDRIIKNNNLDREECVIVKGRIATEEYD